MLSRFSSNSNVNVFMKRFLGISPRSAFMLTSIFNPYGVNGFNPIFLVGFNLLFSNYLSKFLEIDSDWDEQYKITDAPRKALEGNVSAGFHDLVSNAFWFRVKRSVLNFVKPSIDSILTESISNLLPNGISNSIYSEASTCHFLGKEKYKGPENAENKNAQPENILALIDKTGDIILSVNRSIALPFRLYQLGSCLISLHNIAGAITEFLPSPFNFRYGLISFVAISVLTKLAFDKALYKFSTAFDNPSREYDLHRLKDYLLSNSKDILSRNAAAAITYRLQNYLKDENRRSLINGTGIFYFKQLLTEFFESSKDYVFNITVGSAILSNTALNYKDHFVPIISASATITRLLNDLSYTLSDWWTFRENVDNLNELMERVSDAKRLSKEASEKVIIADEGKLLELSEDFVLQVPGLEKPTTPKILKSVIKPREIIRLKGDNAVGKSTLITSILLGDNIKEGCVNRTDSLHISMQNYTPIPGFTLFQDIAGAEEIEPDKLKKIKALFTKFPTLFQGREINDKTITDDLSGGQKRAVKLISAIVSGKDLVILDEPFAEMGVKNIAISMSLIKKEANQNGRGFLIVDHREEHTIQPGFYDGAIKMENEEKQTSIAL
ncbi:MAG: RbsA2 [Candidatus Midichloriaceae bacterium]|jgi:ABC-type lipoprotein export system ATPase subunit|nr:RbsA2 [Candidatus Midichloriaceae bacterium]